MQRRIAFVIAIVIVSCAVMSAQNPGAKDASTRPVRNVVFVCEHGAALSVISAAYFNKFAREHHLNFHAVARGVTPQENLSVGAEAGLKKDGVQSETEKPSGLSQEEFSRADYVVTFLPIPENYVISAPLENWSDVTWSGTGYDKSRDGILKHMQPLFDTLQRQPQPR